MFRTFISPRRQTLIDWNTKMTLGERLRSIREDLGYTQREAAKMAGMRYQYLSNLENGRIGNPSVGTLGKLASAYSLGVDQIIGRGVPTEVGDLPNGLQELLADQEWGEQITEEWLETLLRIDHNGRRLRTKREFLEAYLALSRILSS